MSIESVAASTVTTDALVEAWNAAYAGYFVDVSRDATGLRAHVEAGSIDLGRSVVLRDGGRPIALSLLGARPVDTSDDAVGERGWIGGFGVAPSHRGHGVAGRLIDEQLDVARRSGVAFVDLEVLTQNWARRVYERAGFTVRRRLLVLSGPLDPTTTAGDTPDPPGWLLTSRATEVEASVRGMAAISGCHRAPWGREPTHLGLDADVVVLSTGPGSGTVPQAGDEADGILLLRPLPERVAVLAAAARDDRAAHRLARGLAREYAGTTCRVVNEPEGSPLVAALGAVGMVEELAQHEMRVELSPANAST